MAVLRRGRHRPAVLRALAGQRGASLSGAALPELFVPPDVSRVPHQDETDAVAARRTSREGLTGHARDVVITGVSSIMADGVDSRFFDFIARFPRILHSPSNLIIASSDRSHDLINSRTRRENETRVFEKNAEW